MTDDYLPLTIDVEQVTFVRVSGGWEIHMERNEKDDLIDYTDMPDPIFEQLLESGDLTYEGAEVVHGE